MASLEKDHSYSETPQQPEATPEEYAVAGNANYFGKGIAFWETSLHFFKNYLASDPCP